MSSGRTAISGTTSAAPIRGCTPSWRRRSIRACATATAASSASTTSASSPTRVNTERLWSESVWMSSNRARSAISLPSRPIRTESRPSEKFGADSSGSIEADPTLHADDRPQVLLPLADLARARPRPLPRLRRGRLPAGVAGRARSGHAATRVPVRPGAGRRRGRRAAAVARARGPHAPPLARAGGRRLLRDLLLRLGHTLLSRPRGVGPRRPDADAARAGAVLVLARLGARAAAAVPDRHRRRARAAPAARPAVAYAVRRRAVRAGRNAGRASPPSVRRERLAQRPGEPRAPRRSHHTRPLGARASLGDRHGHEPGCVEPPLEAKPPRRLGSSALTRLLARRTPSKRRPSSSPSIDASTVSASRTCASISRDSSTAVTR